MDKALAYASAIAEAIRELKTVPSGHLYARVMGCMSLNVYTAILTGLKNAEMVSEDSFHVLTWIENEKIGA